MKKIKFLINHYNVIWAVPLLFILMCLTWYKLPEAFPFFGTYDPAIVPSALIQAVASTIGIFGAAKFGLWFTLRTVEKYIFGKKQPQGNIKNYSKLDWRSITALQRLYIAMVSFFFFVAIILIIFLKFI
jgi:hypothetical protein